MSSACQLVQSGADKKEDGKMKKRVRISEVKYKLAKAIESQRGGAETLSEGGHDDNLEVHDAILQFNARADALVAAYKALDGEPTMLDMLD